MCACVRACVRACVCVCVCGDPYNTCAAEEGVAEVGQPEGGHSTEDDTDEPAGGRHEAGVLQSHVAELERVHDGQQPLDRYDGQHEDGHLAVWGVHIMINVDNNADSHMCCTSK